MLDSLKAYFQKLKEYDDDKHTEMSPRSSLENLFNEIIKGKGIHIEVVQEPAHDKGGGGAPDFMFSFNGSIIGYLETKKIGDDLDRTLKTDQIAKYKKLSKNIILTNYLDWIWIRDDDVIGRETLCYQTDLKKKSKPDTDRADGILRLIGNFLSVEPKGIGSAKELAVALAERCHNLRDFLEEELKRQEREHREGRLFGLYETFKKNIFNELTLMDFADAFSQTLGYGLFLGRLNADTQKITLKNAREFIPQSFELIRELVGFLDELNRPEYGGIRWQVGEILSILNTLDLPALREDLSFSRRPKNVEGEEELFAKDPYIYFYEDFLRKYDPQKRKSRGVYYTPPPVVSFIVRAINDILKGDFGIREGLANRERVTVLDFATGTGTFLVEVFGRIFDELPEKTGLRDLIIKEHILKNIYGFEYMIGPYTVAHLKLSQFLKDAGYELGSGERFQVYLTNTLEPTDPQLNLLLPALSREGAEAHRIKKAPILVITGNPPYSGHSKNKGEWITGLVNKAYKEVDGKSLGERNPKWLQDDYVKFIRFAQHKMEGVEEGVVGIITNHSFLDNPTFRGMRQSLMNTFNQIYFLDLHGNAKKKEKAPDGGKDENVFDIEQGVAISIFVRNKSLKKRIAHADVWGEREDKYRFGYDSSLKTIDWKELNPTTSSYLFVPRDDTLFETYSNFWSVNDIFVVYGVGITTAHDEFVIDFDDTNLKNWFVDFKDSERSERLLHEVFSVRRKKGWDILKAWDEFQKIDKNAFNEYTKIITYRPFDTRYIFYEDSVVWRTVKKIMQHMLLGENIGFCFHKREELDVPYSHFFITNFITEHGLLSSKTTSYHAPLYIYDESSFESKKVNFNDKFLNFIEKQYSKKYSPEEILNYIYSVCYSLNYREKYGEFLKYDFPRIPFVENIKEFEELASIGGGLIEAHLMKKIPDLPLGDYMGAGDHNVLKPRYVDAEERLYINKTQYFDNVPKEVWEFHIGGYQVIDKYLKYRKESAVGRPLTLDEINNVESVVKILAFTISQMEKIDEVFNCP